jgi:microcystin-dependent protein
MKKLLTILLFATGISLAVAQDSAPYFLSYQGRVTDGAGLAIGNSTPENRLVRFQIYSSATGGNQPAENMPPFYALAYIIRVL